MCSQNDVSHVTSSVTVTNDSILYLQLFKVPSLPNVFKKSKDSDHEGSSTGAEEEASFSSEYSGGKRVSKR